MELPTFEIFYENPWIDVIDGDITFTFDARIELCQLDKECILDRLRGIFNGEIENKMPTSPEAESEAGRYINNKERLVSFHNSLMDNDNFNLYRNLVGITDEDINEILPLSLQRH